MSASRRVPRHPIRHKRQVQVPPSDPSRRLTHWFYLRPRIKTRYLLYLPFLPLSFPPSPNLSHQSPSHPLTVYQHPPYPSLSPVSVSPLSACVDITRVGNWRTGGREDGRHGTITKLSLVTTSGLIISSIIAQPSLLLWVG